MISPHIPFPWKPFLFRVVVPTILTIILFISGIMFMIIPAIEKSSLERKREMIRELTNLAWSILTKLEEEERAGLLTHERAKQMAIEQIRNMQYGQGDKGYFWINDMTPRMVLHPYRSDLYNRDLNDYVDYSGKRVFVRIVDIVKKNGSGFVQYRWQSYDDPNLVLHKISYVKGFSPWGWIIGTGSYIEDIKADIALLTDKIIGISLVILLIMTLLLCSIISISYQTHRRQKTDEAELKRARSTIALSEKLASLGRLSAMVAHEINNPLSGILSYAKLSTRYLGQETITSETLASVRENLSFIATEAKRCGEIVKDLLLFAKRLTGYLKDAHLNEIIDLSAKIIDHSAKMKDIELVSELDSGDDYLQCDASAIQQIMVALIVNAIEASPQGKKVIIRTDYQDRETVRIKVIDHGAGIPEDVLPHIFEPFFSTKESNKSLGLGLSAVYGIVQHYGGRIDVVSNAGSTTEFTVTLPRVQKVLLTGQIADRSRRA
ncbi:MAG: two component system sensor protein [Syntrophaceae bacterium]|nr:MAG: two component system sensor protein [Syntrophaceae bacterium]